MRHVEGETFNGFNHPGALFLLQASTHDGVLKGSLRFQTYLVSNGKVFNANSQLLWHYE